MSSVVHSLSLPSIEVTASFLVYHSTLNAAIVAVYTITTA